MLWHQRRWISQEKKFFHHGERRNGHGCKIDTKCDSYFIWKWLCLLFEQGFIRDQGLNQNWLHAYLYSFQCASGKNPAWNIFWKTFCFRRNFKNKTRNFADQSRTQCHIRSTWWADFYQCGVGSSNSNLWSKITQEAVRSPVPRQFT